MDPGSNCLRHKPFPTRQAAQEALDGWRASGKEIKGNPGVFRCPRSLPRHFHIGRPPRKGRRT